MADISAITWSIKTISFNCKNFGKKLTTRSMAQPLPLPLPVINCNLLQTSSPLAFTQYVNGPFFPYYFINARRDLNDHNSFPWQ